MSQYQHSEAPKPAPGHTNAYERKTVGRQLPNGTFTAVEELAPVPETAPGGRFLNKFHQWVDAHGNTLEGQPEVAAADTRPRYVTDIDSPVKAAELPDNQKAAKAYADGIASGVVRKRG